MRSSRWAPMSLPLFMVCLPNSLGLFRSESRSQAHGGQDVADHRPRLDLLGEERDVGDVDVEIEQPLAPDRPLVHAQVDTPIAVVAAGIVAGGRRRGAARFVLRAQPEVPVA